METFKRSLNKNAKNGTEREDRSSTQNWTERDGIERNDTRKMERERNDLADGPSSRTERNDLKSRNVPSPRPGGGDEFPSTHFPAGIGLK